MRRFLLRGGASLAATAIVTTSLLTTPASAQSTGGDAFGDTSSVDRGVSQSGSNYAPRVVVTVTSAGVRKTSTVSVPSSSISSHPPCWFEPGKSGPDQAAYWDNGQASKEAYHTGAPDLRDPPPGYADHKNDGLDKGRFWFATCSSEFWPTDDIHAFLDFATVWIDAHPAFWVPASAPDPNTDMVIPPEVLMRVASNNLDLNITPDLQVNPTGNSVVNLPTWVWASDATFIERRARAGFNGNWAEVIATPVAIRVTTDGPATVQGDCAGGGTVYKPGASSNCSVTFRKSSAGSGAYHISATIVWRVHWEGSGGENQPLDPPANPPLGTRAVQVDEVQTVLRNNPTPAN
jgi:hypothetical protein